MSRITTLDHFEEEYRKGIDVPMRPRAWRTVSEEWLRRHSEGSGDYNPLHRDRAYADAARFHSLTGSPSFLFSIDFGANASIWGHVSAGDVAMKDLSILYLGADITWHRPVWLGDRVRSIETPVGVKRRSMPQLGEALVCSGRTDYYNHRGEQIASLTNHMLRFVNPGSGVEASPPDPDRPRIAPDPLVWRRSRRGDEVRYFEDVKVGEELPALPKGTYTTTELYLFSHGTLTIGRSAEVDEGTIDMGAGGRADPEYARTTRAQATQFDYGPQRITWLTQIASDWAGDWGDLVSMSSKLRRPNLVGDSNTVRGEVTYTREVDGQGLVDLHAAVVNQAGVETATAEMTVRLPRRDASEPREIPMLWSEPVSDTPSIYG